MTTSAPRLARRSLLPALLALATPLAAGAQAPPDTRPAQLAAMQRLAYMAGTWEGEGWIQRGAERVTFRGGERVQSKLDGIALLVEGRFTARMPGSDEEVPVHTTLAVISFDPGTQRYRFDTWLATGAQGEHELTLRDDGWAWGFPIPTGGQVRYTTAFTPAGEWHEIGEFSRDGESWGKFFEMKLRRKEATEPSAPTS